MSCFQRSLDFTSGSVTGLLSSARSEQSPVRSADWVLEPDGHHQLPTSKWNRLEHTVGALQLPSFLPPAGVAILGCGTGCCLVALGWSFESVRRYGIQAPRAFTGCGVGIGFGCVGVGQGFGRYVPWAKDTRPPSLRKDLKESVDDVARFFRERFGPKPDRKKQPPSSDEASSALNKATITPAVAPAPKTAAPSLKGTRPQRCIEVRD
ncbi:hypothetical protein F1559_003926 [Cyanidiococcus yangmingshanensis]|uniref:Uncharacterized protein n=1 Tax=Cyanidiococcus yangmingshanensis TaxID=2690220 RepID=A0A7J7IKH5_9RHOD|nr:hypothetical protein F1559_003926 [Cyanidiococcus yangmingshanensis]